MRLHPTPGKRLFALFLLLLFAGSAWGYGGTIGPNEFVGPNHTPTDFKNPLPVPGRPHTYHVTLCNNGSWYGVWYPPEWRGNNGRVRDDPGKLGQHGYAKEEDGTGGGVQMMGNGAGGTTNTVTLYKENGTTVILRIRVIDCSHAVAPGGQRGVLAVAAWVQKTAKGYRIAEGGSTADIEDYLSAAPASESSPEEAQAHGEALSHALPELFAGKPKFVPACSPTITTTNVSCSQLVKDCDKVTEEEGRNMMSCLKTKGQDSADIICKLNGNCPNATLGDGEATRNECPKRGRQWEVDVRWQFQCHS